ncbi:MAG: hypothetical protein ACD_30C00025G0001 [uncultured bacterium]|nr:MAG: hypothetical protein ACD_30C00025G0001 [uncultured bacterium]
MSSLSSVNFPTITFGGTWVFSNLISSAIFPPTKTASAILARAKTAGSLSSIFTPPIIATKGF